MAGFPRKNVTTTPVNTAAVTAATGAGAGTTEEKVYPKWDLKYSEADPNNPGKLIFHKITGLFASKMKDGTEYFRGTVKADDGSSVSYYILPAGKKKVTKA